MYSFIVVLHIISAGVIVGLVTNAILGTSMRKKIKGTHAELTSIRTAAIMSPIMANIGSIGLLLTGVAMTIMTYNSSFFGFNTLPWLAMMQTDFVIIMVIAIAVMKPTGEKIHTMVNAELAGPNAASGASEELRAVINKQYVWTMILAVLVLLAMMFGESKSMMWVTVQ